MISAEERAEIRRLFYAEHWKVGTIAAALGVHRDTVALAIEAERFLARHDARPRPSRLDPFLPFIRETLTRWPRLRATRLYEMLRGRGYAGSAVQLRRVVRNSDRPHRPRPTCGCGSSPASRRRRTGAASARSARAARSGRSRASGWCTRGPGRCRPG